MNNQNSEFPLSRLLAVNFFLLLPTLIVVYFLLWNANESIAALIKNKALVQILFVGLGALSASFIFIGRLRFLPIFGFLCLTLYFIYQGIDHFSYGEFDAFFASIQFLIFSLTFLFGWLLGWGFSRLRFFSIPIAVLFLFASIFLIARQDGFFSVVGEKAALGRYAFTFGPILLYAVYIIFVSELLYRFKRSNRILWRPLSLRLTGFLILFFCLFGGIIFFQRAEIKATIAKYGGGGVEGENSMLKKNEDNSFDLKDYSQLSGSLGRGKQLLFAAHIDYYFPQSEVPNPIYLTSFYYTVFDTLTQTFERDKQLPRNDLFTPDPSKIPLFATKTDSSVLRDALADQFRKTIDIEVYKTDLSPSVFVAPSLSFFVQPLTIEKDFQTQFKSAYRAKSYISELNSAYFVYNSNDPIVREFQEQRFENLRLVRDDHSVPKDLMDYYTQIPKGGSFEAIGRLANQIAAGHNTPVDKVLAVRDFFLERDANGKQIFSYSENPGFPDIPNASLLNYFLFQSKKGYCAYYAGATLFLLRSMGIPSRIAVGFMTVDRSSNNKGWYWYYADQAHAWVQVYFPGYGWLDFDTTIGNDEARESPQPDGTPPMQPPKAYLASKGVIRSVDTLRKMATLQLSNFVFKDREYYLSTGQPLLMDLGIASIKQDSTFIELNQVKIGDSATAVSYADVFKKIASEPLSKGKELLKRFPSPAPIDELYISAKSSKQEILARPETQTSIQPNWSEILIWIGSIALLLMLLLFTAPYWVFNYFNLRRKMAKGTAAKAFWNYKTATFYSHLLLNPKPIDQTYLNYAQEIDGKYHTNFARFMTLYLKQKYANQSLSPAEAQLVEGFWDDYSKSLRSHLSFKKRLKGCLNPIRAFMYH